MSKTPVSELNARMSLDIAPLEQAVPRASALLKRLSSVQAEAFAAQSGGPDIQAMTERMRAAAKQAGALGVEGGGRVRFQNPQDEIRFVEEIAAAHEESLRRRAAREAAMRAEQRNAAQEYLAEVKMVDAAMAASADAQAKRVQEQIAHEEMLADRRAASARAQIEFADAQREIVGRSARDAFAFLDAEQRKVEQAAQQRLKDQQLVEEGIRRTAAIEQQRAMEAIEYEAMLADRRAASARSQIEFADMQRDAVAKSARESFAVFDAAIEAQDQADAQFTASFVNRSAQRRASITEEAQAMVANAANMRRMGTTSADSLKGFSQAGVAMQQAGYQIQDFAVQVTSGTNALVAFSQQASQLLGFFGGWKGAVAGAVISGGILAYRLYQTGSVAKEVAADLEKLSEAVKSVQAIQRGIKFDSGGADNQVRMIREDVALLRQEAVALQIASGYAKTSEDLTANLTRQEQIRGQLVQLAEKERKILAEKAKAEREAAAAAQQEFNDRVNAAIQASLAEGRARMQVVGTELQKLQMDMSEATDLVNSDDPRKRAQGWQMVAAIKAQSEAYKDSLDPLRAQKREIEKILAYKEQGLLEDHEAALLQARIADERERQLRLPDVFRAQTGASFAGTRNTDGTANQLVTLQQQMLGELRKLVWQGSN